MTSSWEESSAAFFDASAWFLATVDLVGDRWADPGLGEWDVRALVGHASRSYSTIETYLEQPATAVEVVDAVAYYQAIRKFYDTPGVAERGREAGRALGENPVAAVHEIAERVVALVRAKDGSELLTSLGGGMRLVDYLPTRTFELVVHTADLCRALGIQADVPPVAARQALTVIMDLAMRDGRAGELLLVATGRPVPSSGFSIL
jgi:uncharacterized protein (TIGR03083 family)